MQDEGDDFAQLRRLLALKKHEVPPPGYFHRFPGEVLARIRMDGKAPQGALGRLESEAPWLAHLWRLFEAKPIYAGAFGAAVCSLLLVGVYFSTQPAEPHGLARQAFPESPFVAAVTPPAAPAGSEHLLTGATNLNNASQPSLFDLVQPLQVAPVAARPK